jgi:hypothetical protein
MSEGENEYILANDISADSEILRPASGFSRALAAMRVPVKVMYFGFNTGAKTVSFVFKTTYLATKATLNLFRKNPDARSDVERAVGASITRTRSLQMEGDDQEYIEVTFKGPEDKR